MSTPTSNDFEPASATGPVLHRSVDAASQALAVAQMVSTQLRQALAARPRATLIVSGGKTPVAMWQALRGQDLDWHRVDITLADERWVPLDHPASNEALVRHHLLQDRAAAAHWVPLHGPSSDQAGVTPEAALPELEARLIQQLSWPADVVVLGMGADGHTASWFPGQVLPDDGRHCLSVPAPALPNVPEPRVSLSPAALLGARCVIVQMQGLDKEAVLHRALQGPPGSDEPSLALALPIRRALWAPGAACQVFLAP
jgi:6-phosphogluconolactonase